MSERTWAIVVAIVIFYALAIVVLTIKSRSAQPSLITTASEALPNISKLSVRSRSLDLL
jgi:hypothetical protein